MAALSLTPFSPYGAVSVVLPLIFVLALGIGREFWEDLRRSRGDKIVNTRPAQVYLDGGKKEQVRWRDLQVGDVVSVSDGDYFPADLLLLSSSGPDGICYVETKNLDGETNLKVRCCLQSYLWHEGLTCLHSRRVLSSVNRECSIWKPMVVCHQFCVVVLLM